MGALVEVGAALGAGKRVFLVSPHDWSGRTTRVAPFQHVRRCDHRHHRRHPGDTAQVGEAMNLAPKKLTRAHRVRLKRINSEYARPYPPDGQAREWWHRLKNAFGTASSAFVDASLQQLIAAARLPYDGISETAVNASLAFIEGAKPQDEVECALVIQMACTHAAAMAVLPRSPELTASLETSLRWRPQRAGCCAPTQSKSRPYGAYGAAARRSCGLSMFM